MDHQQENFQEAQTIKTGNVLICAVLVFVIVASLLAFALGDFEPLSQDNDSARGTSKAVPSPIPWKPHPSR